MVINIANFNFGGDGGGGVKPALLQEKTATIVQNGSQTITPDEGFDGMSSVQINAAITGDSSAIDFSPIGYDAEFSAELNAKWNNDVAYSKTLLDAWNPNNDNARLLYSGNTNIVYAPSIDTSKVTDMYRMFSGCNNLQTVPMYNTRNVTNMEGIFQDCTSLTSVKDIDTSKVTNMSSMFSGCSKLKSVPYIDTSKVTDMFSMFSGCSKLKSVPYIDTSKVTRMNYMFQGCENLTTIPEMNTSNVTDIHSMFQGCYSLTSVPEMDTSNVNNFESMFAGCKSLTTIEGISFKSFRDSTMSYSYLTGWYSNNSIRKAVFKDIGYQSTAVQFNTSNIKNLGVNTDEITDARQSLIDSLITYSFDRAAAGYPTCTITLSDNTKALLTSDEIAQIEAKGFTIA